MEQRRVPRGPGLGWGRPSRGPKLSQCLRGVLELTGGGQASHGQESGSNHPSSPAMLSPSPSVSCPIRARPCPLAYLPPPILPVLPQPAHTALQAASARTVSARFGDRADRMLTLSPAPCFPVTWSAATRWSCGLEGVCLMCLASAHGPSSWFWPDTRVVLASPHGLPSCPASSSALYFHCFVLSCLKK